MALMSTAYHTPIAADADVLASTINGPLGELDAAIVALIAGTTPMTAVDINGGSIDGTPIGAAAASTGVFTSLAVTVTTATSANLSLSTVAGQSANLLLNTAGVARWSVAKNDTAESGANAGSDFVFARFDDAGAYIDSPLLINRATGALTIANALDHDGSTVGFYGTTPQTKPTVTGSRGGNAALASLCTQLAALGLITDSTS
jgi:hypothetical protein